MRTSLSLSILATIGLSLTSGMALAEPAQYLPLKIENLPNCQFWHWVNPSEGEKLTWSGECKEGFAHGEGRADFWITKGDNPKRHSFEGLVQKGKAVKGRYKNEDGSITEGSYSKDGLEGPGKQTFANGVSLSGNFSKGTIEGIAELTTPNGSRFRAHMKKGKFQGDGVAYFANGSKSNVTFLDNKITSGGALQLKDGTQINAPHKNGVANGKGVILYTDGKKYHGPITNNVGTGKGFIRYETGTQYRGDVVDGMAHGKGKMEPSGGSFQIQGEFKDDLPHNRATTIFKTNDSFQSRYHVGRIIGESLYTRKDGVSCSGYFNLLFELEKPGVLFAEQQKVGRCYMEGDNLIFERNGVKSFGKSNS